MFAATLKALCLRRIPPRRLRRHCGASAVTARDAATDRKGSDHASDKTAGLIDFDDSCQNGKRGRSQVFVIDLGDGVPLGLEAIETNHRN
jgi:hypothetical protein